MWNSVFLFGLGNLFICHCAVCWDCRHRLLLTHSDLFLYLSYTVWRTKVLFFAQRIFSHIYIYIYIYTQKYIVEINTSNIIIVNSFLLLYIYIYPDEISDWGKQDCHWEKLVIPWAFTHQKNVLGKLSNLPNNLQKPTLWTIFSGLVDFLWLENFSTIWRRYNVCHT